MSNTAKIKWKSGAVGGLITLLLAAVSTASVALYRVDKTEEAVTALEVATKTDREVLIRIEEQLKYMNRALDELRDRQ